MEFGFNDQERQFADSMRRYAIDRLLPDFPRWDRGEQFPRDRIRELGALGVTGFAVPAEFGGSETSLVMAGIASEELGRGDFTATMFIQLATIAAKICRHATDRIRRQWLPRLAAGDCIISLGLTEPGVGSDAAALSTRARREGDSYVINGEKASITFTGLADASIVFARTGAEGARGISAFMVPLDAPGVTRRVYKSAGERLSQRGSLIFEDVRIDADHLLGSEGQGFRLVMGAFDFNRAFIALGCIGAASQSLDETIEYARRRHTFGRPLANYQGVSFQIAEHLTALSAARLLSYDCLAKADRGETHTREAAMAKLMGPRASADALHACIILNGWMGYDQELPHEQRLRDVIGLEIGDGTPEIMKLIIARSAIGREFV